MSTAVKKRSSRGTGRAPAFTKGTLFGLAKELGLSPDDAKDMAYSLIGKDSLTKFTQKEINEVCFELMARKDAQKRRPNRATDQQLYKIRELERLLGWAENPIRLAKFVEKYYHAPTILWLTPAQAAKLIESLKSMLARQQAEEGRP